MWKSNNKRGFTLIEVLCTLVIMSLFINALLLVIVNCLKLHADNINKQKYINFMNALSKEIEWNWNYVDAISLSNNRTVFIDKNHMNLEVLKHTNQGQVFTNNLPVEEPYLKISVIDGDILTLYINLYYKAYGKQQNMNIICYKGRYR